jgi:hypothetical protein
MRQGIRGASVFGAVLLVGLGLGLGVGLAPPAGAGNVSCFVRGQGFSAPESGNGTQQLLFRITGTGPCGAMTVQYATSDGTATAGSDYVAKSGSVSFASSNVQVVAVDVIDDARREWSEYVDLDLTSTNAQIGDGTLHASILDDEVASDVVLVADTNVVSGASADEIEGVLGSQGHHVTRQTDLSGAALAGALAGADALVVPNQNNEGSLADSLDGAALDAIAAFVHAGGQLVAVGENRGLFDALFGHQLVETPRIAGELTAEAANTEFSESVPELVRGDATPNVMAITGASLPDSATPIYGSAVATGGVRASAAGDPDAIVAVFPEGDGSATYLGWDWEQPIVATAVAIGSGATIDNGWNGALAASVQLPGLAIGDVTVTEGDSGTTAAPFGLAIDHKVSEVVHAAAATADGTATSGSDYQAFSGTASVGRGATAGSVSANVVGDTLSEAAETFAMDLSGAVAAVLDDGSGVGTILNDDAGVTGGNRGFVLFGGDGGEFAYGGAPFVGTLGGGMVSAKAVKAPSGMFLNSPVVDGITTPSGNGFWLVAADGGVFTRGDAEFFGSAVNLRLNQPIVGIARTPTGKGYLLAAADGGVFAFGDAIAYGSLGGIKLNKPIVSITSSGTGFGYWLVASDGGVFAFGDARFLGSLGSLKLNQPIVDMVGTPTGSGYWLAAADGGVFAFGDAPFLGGMAHKKLNGPIVAIDGTGTGLGYRMTATDGGVFDFGDSKFFGSLANDHLNQPIVGMSTI